MDLDFRRRLKFVNKRLSDLYVNEPTEKDIADMAEKLGLKEGLDPLFKRKTITIDDKRQN